MKVLIIMGGFFPGKKYGGPPVSVSNFCSLMDDFECFIVTLDHDMGEKERYSNIVEGWNIYSKCKVRYLSDDEYNKKHFENVIDDLKPDIIYLQGLFQSCVLPCLQLAKKHTIPVLLAPRGEICLGALNIKRYKKIPYIMILDAVGLLKKIHWQSTSEEETEAIKKWMKPRGDNIHELSNIPSIPNCKFPHREKISGEGRFVFLSRIHPKKNLLSAIKFFRDVDGNALFDIYGSIEDEEYWEKCKVETKKLPHNVKVRYKGLVDHNHVHEVFSQYDAFVFPTLSENYGHVIAESLMVGTPVIISNQTPWKHLEKIGAGWDIPLDNSDKFISVINSIVKANNDEFEQKRAKTIEYSSAQLNIQGLKEEYRKAFFATVGK